MIKRTEDEGLGCFADTDIKKGHFVFREKVLYMPNGFRDIFTNQGLVEYTGYDSQNPNYFVYFIGEARYLNDNFKDSNCRLDFDCGEVCVIAKRDIKAGEQLYLDYTDG